MSGFFGCVSRNECVNDVFYGTDYHSHLGTKRAGMAFAKDGVFTRSIHSLEDGYFRNKFESELPKFGDATMGVGIISDKEVEGCHNDRKTDETPKHNLGDFFHLVLCADYLCILHFISPFN